MEWDLDPLLPRTEKLPKNLQPAIRSVMQYGAPQVQNHARDTAPWRDRTGNARQGLMARQYETGTRHGIVLFHSVPYGLWLEVRWDGRYAVLLPTIQAWGPRIMRLLSRVFGKMR